MEPRTYEEFQVLAANEPDRFVKRFASYSLGPVDVAVGADEDASFTVDTNSVFVWTKTTFSADLAGAAQTDADRVIPLIDVQITDSGAERSLFKEPMRIDAFSGSGQIPFILPVPYLFAKNSEISATLTNFAAAGNDYENVMINFIGYRVYGLSNE